MIADIIVIAIIAFSAYHGWKKGFVKSIVRLCCFIVSIAAARMLYQPVSEAVSNSAVGDGIRNMVGEKTQEYVGGTLPSFMQGMSDRAVGSITDTLIYIVSILIIVLVTYFITKIVSRALNLVAKLPGISFLNRTAGLVIGGFIGIFIAYMAVSIVIFAGVEGMEKWLDGSQIAYKMCTENLFFNLFF